MVRRDPERLSISRGHDKSEIVVADVLEPETRQCFSPMSPQYYLIHGMRAGDEFRVRDRQAACNFARAAEQAGLGVIYLGGLDNLTPIYPITWRRDETGNCCGNLRRQSRSFARLSSSVQAACRSKWCAHLLSGCR